MKKLSNWPCWQNWISAIRFLTIIPCGSSPYFSARGALPLFPLCGMCIGGLVAVVDAAASTLWTRPAASLLDMLVLVMVTGALHLDGLADTADGLYGHRDPEKALAIMKDSRIGAIGAVAMICCLALKWAGLTDLQSHRWLWLILIPAYARSAVLFGIRFLPYGRPGGTGYSFFQDPLHRYDFWGLGLVAGLSLLTGGKMVLANLVFAAWVICILAYYRSKVQCITGDMLGAMIETSEALLFFAVAAGDGLA